MAVKIVYFVHGTTYDNQDGLCSGWKQVKLNEIGKEQAKNLGKNVSYNFDMIFTSDLIRAIDSAKIAWPDRKSIQDARLRECNYGDYDGKSKSLVIYGEHIDTPFPNGESLKEVENRISDFLNYLKENYDGKQIAIVSHRAPQLALEVITKKISWIDAINNDWRKQKKWQPGWLYEI